MSRGSWGFSSYPGDSLVVGSLIKVKSVAAWIKNVVSEVYHLFHKGRSPSLRVGQGPMDWIMSHHASAFNGWSGKWYALSFDPNRKASIRHAGLGFWNICQKAGSHQGKQGRCSRLWWMDANGNWLKMAWPSVSRHIWIYYDCQRVFYMLWILCKTVLTVFWDMILTFSQLW